ncbi:hypothetical protein BLA29_004627 [Euroglyphus maynei]|uniref:Fibronectin type-III domain-containing protein n=1 Tax=Euroglyphus maynei TaxID=6958 RepID=A0A1Y3AQ34_EURMA|nr:hypothetical protein BLA29_004627 [Euroglyphus maynei]
MNYVPDPPGKPFIMSFTSRSVNLSWAPSFNSHNSPNGDWDSMNGISTLDNRTEYYIDKLQPFTVYSFRVIAVNAIGASQPSKESYYTVTLREIPDGIPIGFRCVNKSSSSLSFEWHPPPRNTIHGEFIGYRLRYHKNGNSASLLVLHEREITIGDPEAKVRIFLFKLKKIQTAIRTPSLNDDSNHSSIVNNDDDVVVGHGMMSKTYIT